MVKTVIILTLSLKFDGYCIAVYDPESNRMIRLVKDKTRENGIPRGYARGINLLDEVEINIIEECPIEHQTENVIVDLQYGFHKTGRSADIETIYTCLQKSSNVFGNTNYKIEDVSYLDHSLEIIRFERMRIVQRIINGKQKTKASFKCESKFHFEYSVTDANYFDSDLLIESGYSIVSLPVSDEFTSNHGYYKYISAIYPDW